MAENTSSFTSPDGNNNAESAESPVVLSVNNHEDIPTEYKTGVVSYLRNFAQAYVAFNRSSKKVKGTADYKSYNDKLDKQLLHPMNNRRLANFMTAVVRMIQPNVSDIRFAFEIHNETNGVGDIYGRLMLNCTIPGQPKILALELGTIVRENNLGLIPYSAGIQLQVYTNQVPFTLKLNNDIFSPDFVSQEEQ